MNGLRILVACVGNIFLGDDAFGVEVAARLACLEWPEAVRVVDFGIRGLDLTYALLDGYDAVILVDAAPRGEPPGTLYVLEPDASQADDADSTSPMLDMHGMDPVKVLRLVGAMGGQLGRLLLVGCEPSPAGDTDDMRAGLSAPVRAAVDDAVILITALVARLLRGEDVAAGGDDLLSLNEVPT